VQQLFRGRFGCNLHVGKRHTLAISAVPASPLPPSAIDQNPPHRLSCHPEEMAPVGETVIANQSHVRLVDESGGVESVAGGFGGNPRGGKFPQLVVNERQQLGSGLAVTLLGSFN
jgi:hypothetical protein